MKLINPLEKSSVVQNSLSKFGHFVEHHLEHYLCTCAKDNILVFFDTGKRRGVLASHDSKGNWHIFPNGVLAPPEERWRVLHKVLSYLLLKKKVKKVGLEVDERFHREIVENLSESKEKKALRTNYILYWPVFHMELFDAKLKGRKWKKMRNMRNRFKRNHSIRIVDAKAVPKKKLEHIVGQWMRKRKMRDVVTKDYYFNAIRSGFKGFDCAKVMYIDGEPCSITAGWEVSNGEKHYYSAIGILNYAHDGLGEFANLMDLLLLKKKGYRVVDFGGSGYTLLNFKNKFRPHAIYKTYVFSVVKR
jgi:hypothetical protein